MQVSATLPKGLMALRSMPRLERLRACRSGTWAQTRTHWAQRMQLVGSRLGRPHQQVLGHHVGGVGRVHAQRAGDGLHFRGLRGARQQQLDDELAGRGDPLRGGDHAHPVLRGGGAGGQQAAPARAGHLHQAEAAAAVRGQVVVVAEGGDLDPQLARPFQYGHGGLELQAPVVDGDRGHYCILTASKRQTLLHIPHLMQASWSMTCSFLRSPAMQFTGQFLKQAWQPVHLSSRMK